MVNNRAILGFFIVLLLVVGLIFLIRRSPTFLSRIKIGTPKATVSVTPTPYVSGTVSVVPVTGAVACSDEILAQNCDTVEKNPVCGSERIVENGTESTRQINYLSACHYCRLYGSTGTLDMGDTKFYSAGYINGVCPVTK